MTATAAYLAFWLVLAVVAIANGMLREAFITGRLGERAAHQVSTITLMALCGGAVFLFALWLPPPPAHAAAIGAAWVVMTVAFEFVFGRLVAGHSWSRLLQDYDLTAGRLWPLFLAWLGLLPWLAAR